MIGDKLLIESYHTERGKEICEYVLSRDIVDSKARVSISIAGESGAGKSELAHEIARLLESRGVKTAIIQQDDYFVFPPKTNHYMRKNNIEQVGLYEVKLDFLDSNLRSFKRNENPIYKPLVLFDEDRIITEEVDLSNTSVVVVEGTYTSLLKFVDIRVFIDRDYRVTLETRRKRGRDIIEPFMEEVLKREHDIISKHRKLADIIVPSDYKRIVLCGREDGSAHYLETFPNSE